MKRVNMGKLVMALSEDDGTTDILLESINAKRNGQLVGGSWTIEVPDDAVADVED